MFIKKNYLSQSDFDSLKRFISNNSIKYFCFQANFTNIEDNYRKIAGCGRSYDEHKE